MLWFWWHGRTFSKYWNFLRWIQEGFAVDPPPLKWFGGKFSVKWFGIKLKNHHVLSPTSWQVCSEPLRRVLVAQIRAERTWGASMGQVHSRERTGHTLERQHMVSPRAIHLTSPCFAVRALASWLCSVCRPACVRGSAQFTCQNCGIQHWQDQKPPPKKKKTLCIWLFCRGARPQYCLIPPMPSLPCRLGEKPFINWG